jgi:putative peptidoglycan lipid II flippase
MSLLKNSIVVGVGTMASRFLGLARDMMLAKVLGAGPVSDAFLMALKTPNLVRNILAEGALNVSFVPLLTKHMDSKHPTPAAEGLANSVLSVLVVVLVALSVLGVIFMPAIVAVLAPGFLDDPVRYDTTVSLARIMFPYILFIILTNFIGSILNTMGRFAAMAFVPALLNISFIAFILLAPYSENTATFVAIAVPVGGVMQLGLMWYLIKRSGFKLHIQRPHQHPEMPVLMKRLGPATLGVGVQLLNGVTDSFFASMLAAGSVTYLFYAERFYLLPVALIGIAVSTALLPDLSRALHRNDNQDTAQKFNQALIGCFALGLAAAIGLMTLAKPIMQLVYEGGQFTPEDAIQTAFTLMAYVVCLPAVIATKITATAFYAHGDTKTPVRFAVISLVLNAGLNILLMYPLKHVGLALSTSIAAWTVFVMQLHFIYRKGLFPAWNIQQTLKDAGKALGVGLVMLLALLTWMFNITWPEGKILQASWLVCAIGLGGVIYLGGLQLLGLFDLKPIFRKLLLRVKR